MKKLNLKQKIELKKLKDHNISVLEIHYDGGGDDGMIHDINAFDKDYKEIIIPKFCEKNSAFGIKTLEDTFYELLCDNIEWDWVNNDGVLEVSKLIYKMKVLQLIIIKDMLNLMNMIVEMNQKKYLK